MNKGIDDNLVVPAGFEPAECQIQSLMPYHLAMGQYLKLP